MISQYASGLFAELRQAVIARRWGHNLRVVASNTFTDRPTVYFLTPDYKTPSGGVRVIYRHVDILNEAGLNARVLHQKAGFRCNWFDNNTRISDISKSTVHRGDLLVVSELDVSALGTLPKGIGHIIFNQNSHLTWERHRASGTAYSDSCDLRGVLSVSDHNVEMLRYAYPTCNANRIRLSIEPELFYFGTEERPQRIAYMPRRATNDAGQVLEVLRGRGALDGWEVVALKGLSHRQVAEELRRTRIFLAFTQQEGFGLPAAEAMACGCYVIGNHGFGGREFFLPDFCAPIDHGDIVSFSMGIEHALQMEKSHPGWCQERGNRASCHVLSAYSTAAERSDVLEAYRNLLALEAKSQIVSSP